MFFFVVVEKIKTKKNKHLNFLKSAFQNSLLFKFLTIFGPKESEMMIQRWKERKVRTNNGWMLVCQHTTTTIAQKPGMQFSAKPCPAGGFEQKSGWNPRHEMRKLLLLRRWIKTVAACLVAHLLVQKKNKKPGKSIEIESTLGWISWCCNEWRRKGDLHCTPERGKRGNLCCNCYELGKLCGESLDCAIGLSK